MTKIKHNPQAKNLIDNYISESPEFSKPILNKLRTLIMKTDPEITEDWKWGPNYYKQGMVCGFVAFKQHVTFFFFQGAMMKDPYKLFNYGDTNQHNRSIKLKSIQDIDEKKYAEYIKEAVANNVAGIKSRTREIEIPEEFGKILAKNSARDNFDKLTFTRRKEMIQLFLSAKKPETLEIRITKILEELNGKNNPN